MENNSGKDHIDTLFEVFYLDRRASQRELELAYDTLTKDKNLPNSKFHEYRLAFEYLMLNHFKAKYDELNIKKEDYYTEEQHLKNILQNLPEPIKEGVKEVEKETNLSEKALALLAVQKVNLPMFFKSITKNCCKFLGIEWWTKKSMNKVISECMANPLIYHNLSFSFTCTCYIDKNEIYSFVKNMAKYYSADKTLCKEFRYDKTPRGVTGWAVLENDLAYHLTDTLHNKAEILDCGVSITSSI